MFLDWFIAQMRGETFDHPVSRGGGACVHASWRPTRRLASLPDRRPALHADDVFHPAGRERRHRLVPPLRLQLRQRLLPVPGQGFTLTVGLMLHTNWWICGEFSTSQKSKIFVIFCDFWFWNSKFFSKISEINLKIFECFSRKLHNKLHRKYIHFPFKIKLKL